MLEDLLIRIAGLAFARSAYDNEMWHLDDGEAAAFLELDKINAEIDCLISEVLSLIIGGY